MKNFILLLTLTTGLITSAVAFTGYDKQAKIYHPKYSHGLGRNIKLRKGDT